MKTLQLILLALVVCLFSNCEYNPLMDGYNTVNNLLEPAQPENTYAMTVADNSTSPNTNINTQPSTNINSSSNEPIEMKPIRDTKTGRITSYFPLPKSWRITPSQGFEGPNGIRVNSRPTESYYFNIDPYVAQMTGKKVSNPVPLQNIFQNQIAPSMQQQGGRLLKQYPLQQTAQRTQQLMQRTFTRSRLQSYSIIASEWQKANGYKTLVFVSQGIMHSQGTSGWWISITELDAPQASFEAAKEAYLYAQANWQVDRQTAMAHAAQLNRREAESNRMLAQNQASFNARMRSNEAAFQATQRAHVASSNAISDGSMSAYWSRAESQDRMRNKEVNAIHEEYTVVNPWDYKSTQVQAGYKTYYTNSQGDIIGSNDPNFNPNVHKDYRNSEWRKMPRRY